MFLSLIVCPQADNLNRLFFFQHFIDQPVLHIDPSGVQPLQLAHLFFIAGRRLPRILPQDLNERPGFAVQMRGLQFRDVLATALV